MKNCVAYLRQSIALPALSVATCALCLGLSSNIIIEHIRAVMTVSDVSLPLLNELPELERRRSVLERQLEISQLHAATRIGSHEESVHIFSLPETLEIDRLVALFEVFNAIWEKDEGLKQMSELVIDEEIQLNEHLWAVPLRITYGANPAGREKLFHLIQLAGMITVADTLSEDDIAFLLERTEAENPAGVVALEQFFSLDLLSYIEEPRPYERQLRQSFSSPEASDILKEILEDSLLVDAKQFYGGSVSHVLRQQNLWPMPMMTVEAIETKPGGAEGWDVLTLKLFAYQKTHD